MDRPISLLKPLAPVSVAGTEEKLLPPGSIKAVIFDVYGTLLISESGDIGADHVEKNAALKALEHLGVPDTAAFKDKDFIGLYFAEIKEQQQQLRQKGIPYPEIDILKVWKNIFVQLHNENGNSRMAELLKLDLEEFAFTFENLTNHTWPMPGMRTTLDSLKEKGIPLGIISNAQYYTPFLLNHFLENENADPDNLPPFDPELCYFSYKLSRSKPDTVAFEQCVPRLEARGIKKDEILFVGNDMLKDVYPASRLGIQTCLFAGDRRSLKLRKDRSQVQGLAPDCIVHSLEKILDMI